MRHKWITISSVILAVFLLSGCQKEQLASVDETAPDIAVFDAADQPVNISQFRGKPVILEFWSSTCGACILMMKKWQAYIDEHPDTLSVVGVNIDDGDINLDAFAQKYGFAFTLGQDQLGITRERYLISVTPTTFFIDRDGVIRRMHIGYSAQMKLENYINPLLTNNH